MTTHNKTQLQQGKGKREGIKQGFLWLCLETLLPNEWSALISFHIMWVCAIVMNMYLPSILASLLVACGSIKGIGIPLEMVCMCLVASNMFGTLR